MENINEWKKLILMFNIDNMDYKKVSDVVKICKEGYNYDNRNNFTII